jgi:hypothetical protein
MENWICYRPQAKVETPTLLGQLEKANLYHWNTRQWTKSKTQ